MPVWRDNPQALASGLLTVQAHKSCSISPVPHLYLVYTLHIIGYLMLKVRVSWHCGTNILGCHCGLIFHL